MQDQHGQWVRVVFGHGHLAYWTDLRPYEPHTNDHDRTGSALLTSTTSDIYPHLTSGLYYRAPFTAEASKPKTTANHHLICPSGLLQGYPLQAHNPNSIVFDKLATSRDSALRFFRSVVSSQPKVELVTQYSDPQQERRNSAPQVPQAAARAPSDTGEEGGGASMPSLQALHHRASNVGLGLLHSPLARQSPMRSTDSLENIGARARANSLANAPAKGSKLRNGSISTSDLIPEERPIASSAGVSVGINLAEPVLFLQGFQEGENAQRSTAMLRGALHLKVTKTIKIKTISLKFKGTATTKWPEGMRSVFRLTDEVANAIMQVFHLRRQNLKRSTRS